MSEPAVFILIRDGNNRYYADRWAGVFMHREIMWGPEEFEAWATRHTELDEFEEDAAAGVLVDYDRQRLLWCGYADALETPRVRAVYQKLLQQAWPGLAIDYADRGIRDLAAAAGVQLEDDEYSDHRLDSIKQAARIYDDEEDEEFDDDETRFEDTEARAWVTVVEQHGTLRHRHLGELPNDLLLAVESPLAALGQLPAAEVPDEAVVAEGMWIDRSRQTIGIWGNSLLRERLEEIGQAWDDWQVQWADRGYAQQCEVSGLVGQPMSEAEALAKFLPIVLSTMQFDISTMTAVIGISIRSFAVKAVGCLVVVVCLPMLIFGAITGMWQAVLITCAVMVGLAVIGFKVVEYRFTRSASSTLGGAQPETKVPVAGPLDEQQRRRRIEQYLAAAGLPPLAKIEPLFPAESDLDALG